MRFKHLFFPSSNILESSGKERDILKILNSPLDSDFWSGWGSGLEKSGFLGFGPLRVTFAKYTFSFEEPIYEKRSRQRRTKNKKENNDGNSGPLTSLPVGLPKVDRLQR